MSLFDGNQHLPFTFEAPGDRRTGALLIHGFTGTPAELRPLASALVERGISAHGPLLPGSGKEFRQLKKVKHQQWFERARQEWAVVREQYEFPVLIGFSLGGAIATELAVEAPPERLVLLAPFWQMAVPRAATMLSLLRYFHRDLHPFGREKNGSPEVRDALIAIDPEGDPDDPATQARFRREYVIPSTSLLELVRAGKRAGVNAPRLTTPTLVIQGLNDHTVLSTFTRDLVAKIPGEPRLVEVESDHQLVRPSRPAWPEVRDMVLDFVQEPA